MFNSLNRTNLNAIFLFFNTKCFTFISKNLANLFIQLNFIYIKNFQVLNYIKQPVDFEI